MIEWTPYHYDNPETVERVYEHSNPGEHYPVIYEITATNQGYMVVTPDDACYAMCFTHFQQVEDFCNALRETWKQVRG